MTRTFIALELNKAVQCRLVDIIRQAASALPGVRWVDPAGIHLTLAFLGELDDARRAEAMQAAEATALHTHPFSYTLSHLGIFGSSHQPRVVWMGIQEPTGSLSRLHHALNQELLARGFEVDRRPFAPHLTLARIKVPLSSDEQERLQEILVDDQRGLTHAYPVTSIQVMKSELLRSGAQYTSLRECTFKA